MLCGNPAPRSLGFRPGCDPVYQVSLQQLLTSVKPQLSIVIMQPRIAGSYEQRPGDDPGRLSGEGHPFANERLLLVEASCRSQISAEYPTRNIFRKQKEIP